MRKMRVRLLLSVILLPLVASCNDKSSIRCPRGTPEKINLEFVAIKNASLWLPSGTQFNQRKIEAHRAISQNCCELKILNKEMISELPEPFQLRSEVYYRFQSHVSDGYRMETTTDSTVNICGKFIEVFKETHLKRSNP